MKHCRFAIRCWTITSSLILSACAAPHGNDNPSGNCDIRIGGAVLSVAAENHFPYRRAVDSACSGKSDALINLLLFTDHTDGEASLDHGSVLIALRQHIGKRQFNSALHSLSEDQKNEVKSLLETSEKLHRATLQIERDRGGS
jgi:hypothetical protein